MMARLGRFEGQNADLHDVLPRADHDLEAAGRRLVVAPGAPPTAEPSDLRDKRETLAAKYVKQSERRLDHALVIAVPRRPPVPHYAPALFRRIWRKGEADEAVRQLVAALLHRLNDAPDTMFRRIMLMRRALPARPRPRPQDGT